MREQRVALEDGVDRPLERRQRRDVLAVEQDFALVGKSKPAISLSSVVLPQPDGPEQREELVFADRDGDIVECGDLAVACAEDLADAADVDRIPARSVRHAYAPLLWPALAAGLGSRSNVTTWRQAWQPALLNRDSTRKRRAGSRLVGHPAAADRRRRPDFVQPLGVGRLDIARKHDEIGEIAGLQPALAVLDEFGIGALDRVAGQRLVQRKARGRACRLPRVCAASPPACRQSGRSARPASRRRRRCARPHSSASARHSSAANDRGRCATRSAPAESPWSLADAAAASRRARRARQSAARPPRSSPRYARCGGGCRACRSFSAPPRSRRARPAPRHRRSRAPRSAGRGGRPRSRPRRIARGENSGSPRQPGRSA